MVKLENRELRELIRRHCEILIRSHCYLDFVDYLIDEYESLYFDYLSCEDDDSRTLVADMLEALYAVLNHGDIVTLSIFCDDSPSPDIARVVYEDGYVTDKRTTLTYFFDLFNPDSTFVDMCSSENNSFRILITYDLYTAFNFICNSYDTHNMLNYKTFTTMLDSTSRLYRYALYPHSCTNRYGLYTPDEYRFADRLI